MAAINNIPISSTRKIEESEKVHSRQRNGKPDRSALIDITNDSPIGGIAKGSLKTPSSLAKKTDLSKQTPGSGESLLRGQVKTLLQKVEEAELSKLSFEASDAVKTPHFKIQQAKKQETLESQRSLLLSRSLLLEFSGKSEVSDSAEEEAGELLDYPRALDSNSAPRNMRFLTKVYESCDVKDLCEGLSNMVVGEKKILTKFEAMSKRKCESQKLNSKIETLQISGSKKLKRISKLGGEAAALGLISKDEAEAVETLFALAGSLRENKPVKKGIVLREESVKIEANSLSEYPIFQNSAEQTLNINYNDDLSIDLKNPEFANDTSFTNAAAKFELHQAKGLKLPLRDETSCRNLKPWTDTKLEQERINGNKGNDTNFARIKGAPTLWAGLSTTFSCSSQVPFTRAPSWMDSSATKTTSSGNGVPSEKFQPVRADSKRSWKGCAAHVYISRLIRDYQIKEKKLTCPIPPYQFKPNEGTTIGLVENNELNRVRDVKGVKNSNEVHIDIIKIKKLREGQKQYASMSSGIVKEKQSFDFLSLSSVGGSLEPNSITSNNSNMNKVGNMRESSAQIHVPYLHPIVQHQPLTTFPLNQSRYPYSPFSDQLPVVAAKQLQLPHHVARPSYGPQHSVTACSTQQQQQQQMWAAHIASQYRPGRHPGSYLPNWQNRRVDSPPCTQSIDMRVLQQQQQWQHQQSSFAVFPSLSSSTGKQLQQSNGGFHSNSPLHL
ncbi:hypothetical protein GIB67_024413 [Kingdonia uniflora]|uniref:Uncharacterized protein n=1 Tax=Kingdonia uniflora TaxID=39325 RepID=A0A7J7L502_9MAGN|nr:hypothetical protein GIB67_024413 [Kingdonia uniflora]